jgi:nuclear transport factor 2 (NTF2) superfamily protein
MAPMRMARLELAIRNVIEFTDAFNRHDVDGMMHLMSDDCIFENTTPAPDGAIYNGKVEVTRYWQEFFQKSPHAHIEIEEIFSFGFRCVLRWKYEWEDLSGIKSHVRGVDIFKVENGLISEKLSYVKG